MNLTTLYALPGAASVHSLAKFRESPRFVTLDAMRGVAAIAVMQFHYLFNTRYPWFGQAYYAVDFFFCLSGIILTHAYADRIAAGMRFGEYMGRRLLRFYPAYLLGVLLGVAMLLDYFVENSADNFRLRDYVGSVIASALFLPYPNRGSFPFFGGATITGALFPVNVPAWSLFFELLASMALFVAVRVRLRAKPIILVSAALLVLALLHYRSANIGWSRDNFLGGFPRTALAFFLGVALYRGCARMKLGVALPPWLLLGLTAAMFACPFGGAAGLAVAALLIPLLLLFGLADADASGHRRLFVQLGRISFAIYAIHWPVYHLVAALAAHSPWARQMRGAPLAMAGLASAAVLAGAYLLTAFIDEPVRRRLGRRLFPPKPRLVAPERAAPEATARRL